MAKLIIGSRGSQLALTQTHHIRDQLCAMHTDPKVEIEIIRTTGDGSHAPLRSFGGQGVFTKELENALLDGRVDLAVHSLKDLPTQFHPDLDIVATPPREDVRDALISNASHPTLSTLPEGALVGTGSPRRQTQLRALRPDLQLTEIRGNLDTRIDKVSQGEFAAIVLAAAAGYVDAAGFLMTGGFFVSFMSGNSTRLGVGLFRGAGEALIAGGLIAAFVSGVVIPPSIMR